MKSSEKKKAYQRAWHARKARERQAVGLCARCGKEPSHGRYCCTDCEEGKRVAARRVYLQKAMKDEQMPS